MVLQSGHVRVFGLDGGNELGHKLGTTLNGEAAGESSRFFSKLE